MQQEITQEGPLLDNNGHLVQSGWGKHPFLQYDRSKVRAHPLRIKEFDFYEIRNDKIGLFLVIYDVGYQGKIQATFMDFEAHEASEACEIEWFPKGNIKMPHSSKSGDIQYSMKNAKWECVKHDDYRQFKFDFPDFMGGRGFSGEIKLMHPSGMESMVNVIPFKKPTHFVYAQKINCMQAFGKFTVAGKEYEFNDKNPAFGCLDWTRAVFPYKVHWCWSSASGLINKTPFGFNIDYGFGTESSKNMLFYNNKGHHLDEVTYTWNPENLQEDWVFTSLDKRVNLLLHPTFIHREDTNFVLLRMNVIKAYGYFTGEVVLDSGEKLKITKDDRLFGHAEYVENRW